MYEYGELNRVDVPMLEAALDMAADRFGSTIRVVEIGVGNGKTARKMAAYLAERQVTLHYWGVDTDQKCGVPFPGARLTRGDSFEASPFVWSEFHVLILDGCGCPMHTVTDVTMFGAKLVPHGLMLVHDTGYDIPDFFRGQRHGPTDLAESFCVPRLGLSKLGLWPKCRHPDWKLIVELSKRHCDWGGYTIYERTHAVLEAQEDRR